MKGHFPEFKFSDSDVQSDMARFVVLGNPKSYPFDQHHSHQYNEIIYFQKGGGVHSINFKDFPIEDNSVHVIKSGDLHWMERSRSSSGWAIVYKESLLWRMKYMYPELDYAGFYNGSSVINFPEGEAGALKNLLMEVESSLQAPSVYQLSLISAFLSKIIVLKSGVFEEGCPQQPDPVMFSLMEMVEAHYNDGWSPEAYARAIGLSENQLLYYIRKNAQGKSLFQLIQERKLSEAKRLLVTSSYTISEIAYRLEFNEVPHFTNWFKKLTQLNPSQFRKGR